MDINIIKTFFLENGCFTAVISAILVIVELFTEKLHCEKLPDTVKKYIPVIIAVILEFIGVFIESGKLEFKLETVYSGIIAYLFSVIIVSTIKKIKRGELDVDIVLKDLILQILGEYTEVGKKSELATKILNIVSKNGTDLAKSEREISKEITKNCKTEDGIIKTDELAKKIIDVIIGS